MSKAPSDAAWFATTSREPTHSGLRYSSQYVTMRDGVRLAIDLYLPRNLRDGEQLPTILHQTRYCRSVELRRPLRPWKLGPAWDHTTLYAKRRKYFVTRGYAWMDVDARGSGSSFGSRLGPWSPDEVRDGAQLVDFIVDQPWSNGNVGAMGISYDGTAAEFLAVNKHPAVKAVAPRFSLFDLYTDIAFPGGVHHRFFTKAWQRTNESFDRNALHEIAGPWVKLFVTGVTPVRDDADRSQRAAAVAEHAGNLDIHAALCRMTHRDDVLEDIDPVHSGREPMTYLAGTPRDPDGSIGLSSPHNYVDDIDASGAAVYGYAGYFDGAYGHAAVKRFMAQSNPKNRLTIGPWNHGGGWNVNPLTGPQRTDFDHEAELLRFFDAHLRGDRTGVENEKPVHYYTLVEGKWKEADSWPPPSTPTPWYLASEGRLSRDARGDAGVDEYRVDTTHSTGKSSRWKTPLGPDQKVRYLDRKLQDDKLLTYTSDPLPEDFEMSGHPVVTLVAASNLTDGTFIVYLEDVDPQGNVGLVTEGLLRALHRKVSDETPPHPQAVPYHSFKKADAAPLTPGEPAELVFDLLPISYLFRAGHRLRVAIAGADATQFWRPAEDATFSIYRGADRASRIDLPVV